MGWNGTEQKRNEVPNENCDRRRRDEQEARLEQRDRFDALDAREIHVQYWHPTRLLDPLHFRVAVKTDGEEWARDKIERKLALAMYSIVN